MENHLLVGAMSIFVNVGSTFLIQELGTVTSGAFQTRLSKYIVMFVMVLMTTRDPWAALVLSGLCYIVFVYLFNAKSRFCIWNVLPPKLQNHFVRSKHLFGQLFSPGDSSNPDKS